MKRIASLKTRKIDPIGPQMPVKFPSWLEDKPVVTVSILRHICRRIGTNISRKRRNHGVDWGMIVSLESRGWPWLHSQELHLFPKNFRQISLYPLWVEERRIYYYWKKFPLKVYALHGWLMGLFPLHKRGGIPGLCDLLDHFPLREGRMIQNMDISHTHAFIRT